MEEYHLMNPRTSLLIDYRTTRRGHSFNFSVDNMREIEYSKMKSQVYPGQIFHDGTVCVGDILIVNTIHNTSGLYEVVKLEPSIGPKNWYIGEFAFCGYYTEGGSLDIIPGYGIPKSEEINYIKPEPIKYPPLNKKPDLYPKDREVDWWLIIFFPLTFPMFCLDWIVEGYAGVFNNFSQYIYISYTRKTRRSS